MKMTETEKQIKKMLEGMGFKVLKGSFPDFFVYDPKTLHYGFVEAKSGWNKHVSKNQYETAQIMRSIGIPVVIWYYENNSEQSEVTQKYDLREKLAPSKVMELIGSIRKMQREVEKLVSEYTKLREMIRLGS